MLHAARLSGAFVTFVFALVGGMSIGLAQADADFYHSGYDGVDYGVPSTPAQAHGDHVQGAGHSTRHHIHRRQGTR